MAASENTYGFYKTFCLNWLVSMRIKIKRSAIQ